MAYDSESERLVLFGGYEWSGELGATWVFGFITGTVTPTPEGWFNPGWVWFSIPAALDNPDANDVFWPHDLRNRVTRWNPAAKNLELYPDDFRNLELGRGYMLFTDEEYTGAYLGTPVSEPVSIVLPARGWSLIGHPHMDATALTNVSVHNETTGVTRTVAEDVAAGDPWVNWNLVYWDSATDQPKLCAPAGGDDTQLRPWYGYRIWTHIDNLTLIVPSG